jgi:peptide/nickel transport system substrate-binding protein
MTVFRRMPPANVPLTRRLLVRAGVATSAAGALLGGPRGSALAGPGTAVRLPSRTRVQEGPFRLTLAQPNEPATLDPQFEQSGIIGTFLNPMIEHLMEFDRELAIKNVLAETAEQPTDGVTYRFKLRPGMTFWDGTPVDANAVKFTYDRGLDPTNRENGLSDPVPILQGVDHVNVVDDLTVEVVTGEPSTLAWPFFCQEFILPPSHYGSKSFEETAIEPMGSGPWTFVSWSKGDRMEMAANPNYWRGKPQIDTLVFQTVPDAATRVALLEAGDVDIITTISPDDLPIIESHDNLRVESALTTFRVHIGVPTNQPKWQDRRARMALNYAINVENIIEFVLGGLPGERTRTPVITEGWANPDIPAYTYDPDEAKALLDAAGFPWDEPVTLYTTASGMKRLDVAQAIASDLQSLGMTVEVEVLEGSVHTDRLRAREFDDLYMHQLGAPSYGPIEVALPTGDLGLDASHFIDGTENGPRYREIYDQVRVTFDDAQQHEMVDQLQALFMEEAPWILLYREVFLFGVNNRTNWTPTEYTRLHFWLPDEDDARIVE